MKKITVAYLIVLAILVAVVAEIEELNFAFANFPIMPIAVTFVVSAVIDSLIIIVYSKKSKSVLKKPLPS